MFPYRNKDALCASISDVLGFYKTQQTNKTGTIPRLIVWCWHTFGRRHRMRSDIALQVQGLGRVLRRQLRFWPCRRHAPRPTATTTVVKMMAKRFLPPVRVTLYRVQRDETRRPFMFVPYRQRVPRLTGTNGGEVTRGKRASASGGASISQLPSDVMLRVFGYLPVKSVGTARQVCKPWCGTIDANAVEL